MKIAKPPIVAACLAAALALAPTAAAQGDETSPTAKVDSNTGVRCKHKQPRVIYRITDASSIRAIVRIDGRAVKRTRQKRFTIRPRLDNGAHTIRTVVRDSNNNRLVHTVNVHACRPASSG